MAYISCEITRPKITITDKIAYIVNQMQYNADAVCKSLLSILKKIFGNLLETRSSAIADKPRDVVL